MLLIFFNIFALIYIKLNNYEKNFTLSFVNSIY